MPTPRAGVGVAAITGLIYAVGGSNHDLSLFSSSIVERYDPATDQWTQVANLPVERDFIAAVALNGKLYAFGGLINEGNQFNNFAPASNAVFRYDPEGDQWVQRAGMSVARYCPAVAALDGQIYVVGGRELRESPGLKVTEEHTP